MWGISPRRVVLPAAIFGSLGLLSPAAADMEEDCVRYEKQIELLENKATLVRSEVLKTAEGNKSATRLFEERLNDGQTLMLLQDYVRAAIIFHSLVENQNNKSLVGYLDAVFNLGEALFLNRNFIDARTQYLVVLNDPRGRLYRKQAIMRLMQIALRNKQFDEIDRYHLQVRAEGTSSEAEYLWAKTLFARGRLDDATSAFSGLIPGQPYYLQARYFQGVIAIRKGQLDAALVIYNDLVRQPAKTAKDAEVLELAHLARGRLLHDLGDETSALDAFQAIEHTSPFFDQALFEICWTYIQRAEKTEEAAERERWFTEASRAVEILEVSTPDSTFVPRAILLKGHILEKMDKFDEAAEMFGRVSSTYASVKEQLDALVTTQSDPVAYFNEIAGRELETFNLASYVPPTAVSWLKRQDELAAAIDVVRDLESSRRFIVEARELLVKLDELLANESDRINLFPLLLEGAQRANEIENARVILERNLALIEERLILDQVSDAERSTFEATRSEREKLEQRINALPTNQTETEQKPAAFRKRVAELEQTVFQASIGLRGMKGQLSAMEYYLKSNADQFVGRDEAVRDFREEIRRGWAMTSQLETELGALTNNLQTDKARAGLDSEVQAQDLLAKEQYLAALGRERRLAEAIYGRLDSEAMAVINRIDAIRKRSDRLGQGIAEIRRALSERVADESQKVRQEVALEKQNLQRFESAVALLERESQNLAGEVAFRALDEVRERLHKLVLDADVGVLDVAWSRKMATTRKISDITRKQGAERKRLHEEFKGVLKEVN